MGTSYYITLAEIYIEKKKGQWERIYPEVVKIGLHTWNLITVGVRKKKKTPRREEINGGKNELGHQISTRMALQEKRHC